MTRRFVSGGVFLALFCLAAAAPAADCTLGNPGAATAFVEDFLVGDQSFAYLIDPTDPGCCDDGFLPAQATFYLNAPTFDDMAWFSIYYSVREAVWDGAAGGWRPGWEECATGVHMLSVDITGVYTLTLPIWEGHPGGFTDCECLHSGDPWFLVLHVPSPIGEGVELDPAHDGAPVGGRSFVQEGSGAWDDLVLDRGWPGELQMSLTVDCCTDPVDNGEPTFWGRMKSFFR